MIVQRTLTLFLILILIGGCGGSSAPDNIVQISTPAPPTQPPPPTPPPTAVFEPVPAYAADFEDLFSLDNVKTIRVQISEAEWNGLLNDFDNNPRNEVYRHADFYYSDDLGTAEEMLNVGFRLRGNVFSRKRPENGSGPHNAANDLVRAHFKFKFNEKFDEDESAYGPPSIDVPTIDANSGREFRGVRSLNLKFNKNDPTYLREVFSYDLFRRAGVQTVRNAYTRLFIQIGNEPERYMGVYLMGEHADKTWAKRRYDDNSYLFKCLYQQFGPADLSTGDRDHSDSTGAIGIEITDPEFFGQSWSTYRPAYDLKTKDDEFLDAEAALNDLIELLGNNPTQQMLEDAINIPALLKAQAINVFTGQWDDYWRNGNNYYLFLQEDTQKWVFIPYDYDITFFDSIFGISNLATAPFLRWGDDRLSGNPVLMDRVLAFDDFRQLYIDYIRALIDPADGMLNPTNAMARLSELQSVVAPYTSGYDAIDETPYSPDMGEIGQFIIDRANAALAEVGAAESAY